jgi:aminomethyltransferase
MPVGTPFHDRTLPLAASLSYRDWAGYYAASSYEPLHEHEYNALRNAAGLIDISPLFKYLVSGPDAARLVNRIITRDAERLEPGRVIYTPWCDESGHVLDDGTVARLYEHLFRWTAAEPNYRWLRENAVGLDVVIEDVSERVAALALQGPTSAGVLRASADADIDGLKYFHVTRGSIDGRPLRFPEPVIPAIWATRFGWPGKTRWPSGTPWSDTGRPHAIRPVGLLALDVARIEAGLLLIDVDFFSARRALTTSHVLHTG